jgi:hypothetical protein
MCFGYRMAIASGLLMILIVAGCRPAPPPTEGYLGATIEQIARYPNEFAGKTVMVSGEVDEVLTQRVLRMGGARFLFDRNLLVISPQPWPPIGDRPTGESVRVDDIVLVSGTVRLLDSKMIGQLPAAEREALRGREGEPALLADDIFVTPRAQWYSGGVSLRDIAERVDQYIGKRVTISGEISEVIGERILRVGGAQWIKRDVLVLTREPLPTGAEALRKGDLVQVSGEVARFGREALHQRTGIVFDERVAATWEGGTAILADQVTPLRREQ